jgi:hypothetical protein
VSGKPTFEARMPPRAVIELLPGFEVDPPHALDFDAALGSASHPPLELPDSSVELAWSLEAFTRISDGWADWLLDLRRLLADRGVLVIGLAAAEEFERLTGAAWEDSRIGMTVLSRMKGAGGRIVFHSEWWLRAHWGRAFDVVELAEGDGRRLIVLRAKDAAASAEDLARPEPGEDRELAAAGANSAYLGAQLEVAERRVEELREEMNRELMRRSFDAADRDWARRGPGSPAMLVAAEYEATTSWRLTKPLRSLGRLLRRGS